MVVPEGPSGAGQEPLGIHHVRRAIDVDVDHEMRIALDQVPGAAGVVQVHVGEQQMTDVGQPQALRRESGFESLERRARTRIHDCRLGPVDPVRRDHPGVAEVYQVNGDHRHEAPVRACPISDLRWVRNPAYWLR